jgi:hypothetical protein
MQENKNIQNSLDKITTILNAAEKFLSDWNFETRLQIPFFMSQIAIAMNVDEKMMRSYDPVIRLHLRDHALYVIERGAMGGIALKAAKEAKNEDRLKKAKIKAELKALIEENIKEEKEEKEEITETVQPAEASEEEAIEEGEFADIESSSDDSDENEGDEKIAI